MSQYNEVLEVLKQSGPIAELGAMRSYDEITDPKILEHVEKLEHLDELISNAFLELELYCKKMVIEEGA